MVFLFRLNTAVGPHFTVIMGFTIGVGGLFMEENLTDVVQEKAGFCFGQEALGNRMW